MLQSGSLSSSKRRRIASLGLLTVATFGLTAKAFAYASSCQNQQIYYTSGTCSDGSTQWGECVCNSWSASGGYSSCYIYLIPC